MDFSDWLENELNQRGWDQAELTRRTGISKTQISNVLGGMRKAGPHFCMAVAQGLGIPREEVFRVRGWLRREPQAVVSPDADPHLVKMVEAVQQLPFEKREQILDAWDMVLKLGGVPYEHI